MPVPEGWLESGLRVSQKSISGLLQQEPAVQKPPFCPQLTAGTHFFAPDCPVASHLPEQQSEPNVHVTFWAKQETQVLLGAHMPPEQQGRIEEHCVVLFTGTQELQTAWPPAEGTAQTG